MLYATHGNDKYPEALSNLLDLLLKQFSKREIHLYVLDNASMLQSELVEKYKWGFIIRRSASNSCGEFSAWDDGFAIIKNQYYGLQDVLLVNSSFQNGFIEYLKYINSATLQKINSSRFLVGHIEYFDFPKIFRNTYLQHWIRSSFIYTNLNTLKSLKSFSNYFTTSEEETLLKDSSSLDLQVQHDYLNFISGWVSGTQESQGNKWHSKIGKTKPDLEKFLLKCRCILSEHFFTSRLIDSGVAIFDAGYLEANVTTMTIPVPWFMQIKKRPYGLKLKNSSFDFRGPKSRV